MRNLRTIMSRKVECYDSAVGKSFLSFSKRGQVTQKIYKTNGYARSEIFVFTDGFYNPRRNSVN
jgi:DNA-binding IclR family transcriptional regulator